MPILNGLLTPAILALAAWFWSVQGTVTENVACIREAQAEIARMYEEGSKPLKDLLVAEARTAAQFEGVKEDVSEIKVAQKTMQAQMQQLLLMQRELITEVKLRAPTPPSP